MSFYYLATPYSKYEDGLDAASHDACALAAEFIKQGTNVFCPIAHSHAISDHGLDKTDCVAWLALDRPLLDAADGVIVAMLPGWEESHGVRQEIKWAEEAGKEIIYHEVDYERLREQRAGRSPGSGVRGPKC